MSYRREIPRDLFNEANLLKCFGQIYLNLERLNVDAELLKEPSMIDRGFSISQDPSSGDLLLDNVKLRVGGRAVELRRPLNSRQAFPLHLYPDGYEGDAEPIEVFESDGSFTAAMKAFLEG